MISEFPSSRRPRGPAAALARNPIGVAWTIIWLSLLLFAAAFGAAAAASVHYVTTAVRPASATLVAMTGTVLVQEPAWPRPGEVHAGQALSSGDVVWTDGASSAQVRFADGSTVTVQPGSELAITRLRSTRYQRLSVPRRQIDLELRTGKLEARVVPFADRASYFHIASLGAEVSIPEGTTTVWLSQPRTSVVPAVDATAAPFTNSCCATQVLTQDGQASVSGAGSAPVTLHGDQRVLVPMGGTPLPPAPATWDLLVNGSFRTVNNGLPAGWDLSVLPADQHPQDHVAASGGAAPLIHLWSAGSRQDRRSIAFQQTLNRNVADFLHVDLLVRFRIHAQTLPGGGIAGSEYPFRVSVDYIGRSGKEATWFRGFYILDPSSPYRVDPQSQEVLPDQWYQSVPASGSLRLSDLPDPPVVIKWVEFSASGWDFDTEVSEVRLVAQ